MSKKEPTIEKDVRDKRAMDKNKKGSPNTKGKLKYSLFPGKKKK